MISIDREPKCLECGGPMTVDFDVSYTTDPAQYKATCDTCGATRYVTLDKVAENDAIADFGERRWARLTRPMDHKPIDALHAAARLIEGGDPAQHVVIMMCYTDEDDVTHSRTLQAGSFTYLQQIGMIEECKRIFMED